MQIKRIWAIVLRYLYSKPIENRIYSSIYWSIINIVIWGTSSSWLEKQAKIANLHISILTSLALWQIVFRVNIETAKNLYEDLSGKNLINLFASPLKLSEWILASIILGVIETLLISIISSLVIFFIYSVNILNLKYILIPSIFLLLTFGLSIGFTICGLILIFGKKSQDIIYSFGYLFAPFSAIFYPIESMPKWTHFITNILPTTYVFESIRDLLYNSNINTHLLTKSLILNLIYLPLSIIFLILMFQKTRNTGFYKL